MFSLLRSHLIFVSMLASASAASPAFLVVPDQPAKRFSHSDVRLLDGPFHKAVEANRSYLLAHDPDRLLAPYLREAGLPAKAEPYGNWESDGLDGHTAGHYLSALALMIASGDDADGELRRRLDYMVDELDTVQKANGNGYVGGIPGSKAFWEDIRAGNTGHVGKRWAPWYNLHKMFAGLRDAYLVAGNEKARGILVGFGVWCDTLTAGLSDAQMQEMDAVEYGGMNEVMADIYAITGDGKFLEAAKRFNHRAVFEPLEDGRDELTGMHANTQIPKIIGMERIAALAGNKRLHDGAAFFWNTVTNNRSVAFGGNSVAEHFNDPHDFHGLLVHREGPETCNTYNMLRLTEELFTSEPNAAYADYYERALYNHILASIDPETPGYVYFTPIRPDHYRVYSVPEEAFWCCVGTGMENPGRYGEFIYARAKDGIYVNLFIASELKDSELGMTLRQDTAFPDEESSRLTLNLEKPRTFALRVRQPGWVEAGAFSVKVNGVSVPIESGPSSYVSIKREWHDGDAVEIALPMQTHVEGLPDGSPWYAILHGPIVLAHPAGSWEMPGLRADDSRMAHVASGPFLPLDKAPVLLTDAGSIAGNVVADTEAGPLAFRLKNVVEPFAPDGLSLIPFFRLHNARYQMYWETTTREGIAARKERLAEAERALAIREAATIDSVAPGEQQPEVEHDYYGEGTASGIHNGRRWRHGQVIQYTLDSRNERSVSLSITYSGDDSGRTFDIFVNDVLVATQNLIAEKRGDFIEKLYAIPADVLAAAPEGKLTIKLVARKWLAGGVYDVRLLREESATENASLLNSVNSKSATTK